MIFVLYDVLDKSSLPFLLQTSGRLGAKLIFPFFSVGQKQKSQYLKNSDIDIYLIVICANLTLFFYGYMTISNIRNLYDHGYYTNIFFFTFFA